jgi:hypothetical protein
MGCLTIPFSKLFMGVFPIQSNTGDLTAEIIE